MTTTYQIATPPDAPKPFTAAFVLNAQDGFVIQAAPILRKLIMGRWLYEVQSLCLRKRWALTAVAPARTTLEAKRA